jgi:hypothetical protein
MSVQSIKSNLMKTSTTQLLDSSPHIHSKDGSRRRKAKDSRIASWTCEEDQTIKEIVAKYGPKRWTFVASHLPGRRSKQCRERWHNQLHPLINKHSWIDEEEWLLFLLHRKHGSRWASIAKVLQGRTDNSIKNHWNGKMKKRQVDFTFLFNRISSDIGHYYPGHVCTSETPQLKTAQYGVIRALERPTWLFPWGTIGIWGSPLQDGVDLCSALLQWLIEEAAAAFKAKQKELTLSQKRLLIDDKENLQSLAQIRSSESGFSPLKASTGCVGNEGSVLRDKCCAKSNCKLKYDGFFESCSPLRLNSRTDLLNKGSPCRGLDLNSLLEIDWQIDRESLGSDIDLSSILAE